MANPGGGNQFGNYTLQPKYGDVKKATTLLKEAPISGAPRAATAIAAPQRDQAQAQRSPDRVAAQGEEIQPVTPPGPSLAAMWQQIAAIPGISPLAHIYAQAALGS